jgi:DNA-binding GntR family transcriptional regulator
MPDPTSHTGLSPRRNIAREVLCALRSDILSGRLQPGEPLAEPVLAKQFGSSRAPVREALIELEREGLVQFEATGRTRVRTLSEQDFAEIREARVVLETMAARKACLRWSPKDSAVLEANIARQARAATLSELSRLDVELHEYVVRLCGNSRMLRLWQSIRYQFEMSLAFTHRLQQKLAFKPRQITVSSHRLLLAALASGSPEVAAEKMAVHIESSMEWAPPEVAPADDVPGLRVKTSQR